MGTVLVEIAVRDDRRLLAALDSLSVQTRKPDRVLVAASTASPPELLTAAVDRLPGVPVEVARFPGGVVDARAASLALMREDVVAFLDSDERAPPEWLARIVAPVEDGRATFAGGPTRTTRPPTSSLERYNDLLEQSIYSDLVPRRISYLPLQNTAWRASVLRSLGFDPRIPYAEDHDLEVRAARAGAVGLFLPDAWVYHDPGDQSSVLRWARKRYRYLVAMGMSLLKNGEFAARIEEHRHHVRHPLRYVEAVMKPVALLHAAARWRRVRRRPAS
jgi:glycosyltransferase involved in cell wall biosynthesis